MNLKNIKHAKGTGENDDDDEPHSSSVFFDYGMLMLKILAGIMVFNWITSCNFLNAFTIKPDTMYPVNPSREASPYCYGECMTANQKLGDDAAKSEKTILWMMKWWWQSTQEPCYNAGGKLLNLYFTKMNAVVSPMNKDAGDSVISFIKWVLFGLFTQLSLWTMLLFSFLLSIPGYIEGLLSFTVYTGLETNRIVKYLLIFWLFLFYLGITFCFGWVSFFPVTYACIHLLYLFFIKPLMDNTTAFSTEFTKRMKPLMAAFVIMSIIIAFGQLPLVSAGTITGVVVLAWFFMFKNNDTA